MAIERGPTGTDPTFEEHQSLPSWLGPALVALSIPALVVALVAVLETGGPTLRAAGLVVVAVMGPIPLILRSTLRTTVRDDGVYFRFTPFHWSERYISFEEIEAVRRSERRAYQYGLRRTRWGWEYRPNASDGVEIHRTNGPAIFLGSEQPHELRQAIESGMRRTRSG
ncbi:hypothetical protein [Natronorubrum tibetense]|uniref:PH domain-containing protein n=1 Tax=Natronorubrum tibetense GA33 TaxID=1114856 RepID=L9VMK3_9EURY|nr:hypothetical protein [Natronorubrum tibetense]ELY38435.1 hypothetical protein C496_17472 [Natronorubrum tibetense GA33]